MTKNLGRILFAVGMALLTAQAVIGPIHNYWHGH
jgi:hypothetical protein